MKAMSLYSSSELKISVPLTLCFAIVARLRIRALARSFYTRSKRQLELFLNGRKHILIWSRFQTEMVINLTEKELAYLSRAVFRQRIDKPDDEPELAATLDGNLSVWRIRARKQEENDD